MAAQRILDRYFVSATGSIPVFMTGEWVDTLHTHLILTAGVVRTGPSFDSLIFNVQWRTLESLTSNARSFAHAGVHAALAMRGPVQPLVDPLFRCGRLTHRMLQHIERPAPIGWAGHIDRAVLSLDLLKAAFRAAAHAEDDPALSAQLWLWRDRVPEFSSEDIPVNLRSSISSPVVHTQESLPYTHAPDTTAWLPPKPIQPVRFMNATSMADLLLPSAFDKFTRFIRDQREWLQFFDLPAEQREFMKPASRPLSVAINECDFVPEARGVIWDLRTFSTGRIRTLDYTAPITTSFNSAFFRERLANYPDQELLGFLCEGVQLKADFPPQLVLLPHLLSLEGRDFEVYDDLRELERDTGWIRFYEHLPFLPCRLNGKGVVPKKGGSIRPIDEAGGPRKTLFDSASIEVLSLNWMAEGRDMLEAYDPGTGFFDRRLAAKWPQEVKMNGRDVRQTLRVLRSAAQAARLPLYSLTGDMHK
jgi:hypothetical protein